jgi:ribulose-bisphosphate carboxylase large chain
MSGGANNSIFTELAKNITEENFVICKYYVESSLSLQEAGIRIAAEESVGTWTDIKTTTERVQTRLSAKVFEWSEKEKTVKIAFPVELFDIETGGIPNILSIIAGNLFGLSEIKNVRLLDVNFPNTITKAFKGPKFGIEGVRQLVGTKRNRRPHLGTIIKPKVGLNPKETAKVAYEAAIGGVDFIKDDETLTDQKFCPLEERVTTVMEYLDRARSETGRNILYAVNITARSDKMMNLAEKAVSHGANMLMIDVLTAGFSTVQFLAEEPSIKVPLHIHRTMHAAITRNPVHGVHMIVLAKLIRLAGGDQLHTGTAAGKMEGEVKGIQNVNKFLREKWFNLKTIFPVASGGIHPGIVPYNIKLLGQDLIINAGGGIHGHPGGTRSGAMAMRQAIDAYMKGIPVEQYAETHRELKLALEKWPTEKAILEP